MKADKVYINYRVSIFLKKYLTSKTKSCLPEAVKQVLIKTADLK